MLKKFLAITLVLITTFSMAACGGSVKEGANAAKEALLAKNIKKEDILGRWEGEAKIADIMKAVNESSEQVSSDEATSSVIEVLAKVKSDESMDIGIDFKEDGTYDIIYETDSFVDSMKDYYEDVFEVLKKDKNLLMKFLGVDENGLKEIMTSNSFTSSDQVVDLLKKNVNDMDNSQFETILTSSFPSGKMEDGNLVVADLKYEIDGKKLNIQSNLGSDETVTMQLIGDKLVFSKYSGLSVNTEAYIFENGFERADND